MNISIDQNRLSQDLQTLSGISAAPAPAVTRIVFSSTDLQGRDFVKNLCVQAGLTVREDPVGNTFARWPGTEPDLAPVATGSHIDAIPNAGMYDGTVGVLGGLEAIRASSTQRVPAAALNRSDHVHFGGANALRHRMFGKPPDGGRVERFVGRFARRQRGKDAR